MIELRPEQERGVIEVRKNGFGAQAVAFDLAESDSSPVKVELGPERELSLSLRGPSESGRVTIYAEIAGAGQNRWAVESLSLWGEEHRMSGLHRGPLELSATLDGIRYRRRIETNETVVVWTIESPGELIVDWTALDGEILGLALLRPGSDGSFPSGRWDDDRVAKGWDLDGADLIAKSTTISWAPGRY